MLLRTTLLVLRMATLLVLLMLLRWEINPPAFSILSFPASSFISVYCPQEAFAQMYIVGGSGTEEDPFILDFLEVG